MSTEARMLERRVSNNRADLNGDQQMNYFLAWFNQWSDLQRKDFVTVLAAKMSKHSELNGGIDSLNLNDNDNTKKPPSIYECQVKLFRDWFVHWSEDQREYLLLRLKDIDSEFHAKYEAHVSGEDSPEKVKDYFEPGVPAELVRASRKDSTSSSPNTSINGTKEGEVNGREAGDVEDQHDHGDSVEDNREPLSTIQEDE